jgi:MFS family permease
MAKPQFLANRATKQYFTHERGTYMGLYAFFLAGGSYFAPVICGFIAEYQGWQWVFYWPSIFSGFAMIILFFFMEETNYVRKHMEDTAIANVRLSSPNGSQSGDPEKTVPVSDQPSTEEGLMYTKKSYTQKLALLGPKQKQNNMFRQLWQILYYLSWPVVFYAGYVSRG